MLAACAAAFVLAAVVSLSVGAGSLGPGGVLRALLEGDSSAAGRIVRHVRLPRTLATLLAGAGLAASGVITQAVLENPLASPGIIGVNAGAGFGAVLCCALFPAAFHLVPLAAFLGALGTVLLVYDVARRAGASRMTLVLAGVAVSSLLTAAIDAVTTFVPDALLGANTFRIGGVQGVTLRGIAPAGAYILLGTALALSLAHELDVLGLGELTAKSLGMNTGRYRFVFLVLAAALAGAAASFAGLLGFVGLIVPHVARLLVGGDSRPLLGASALLGGAFLTLCDVAARSLFNPYELPVGILVSAVGAPFFLWLLLKRHRQSH